MCVLQVNQCGPDLNQCTNGGVCADAGLYATCSCPPNFSGDYCQIVDDACLSDPCAHGGACTSGEVPECYENGCRRAGQVIRTSYPQYKFNLDPAGDSTGLREWLAFVQLAEIALYAPDGSRLGGATVTNPAGPGTEDSTCGQYACQIDSNGTIFGSTVAALANDNVVQCASGSCLANKWLDYTKGDLIFSFDAPVTVHSYDWATAASGGMAGDPTRGTLEGSLDGGASWTVVESAQAAIPFAPSAARETWQGPFAVDAVAYTPYTCECETGFTGPNCGVDVNECDAAPCGNGGVCIEGPGVGAYTCNCQAGASPGTHTQHTSLVFLV